MYYDRFEEATTSLELSKFKISHKVLCHDNASKFNCIGELGQLIETKEPKGIQNNFNWALNSINDGEWAVFLSDDYKSSKKLSDNKFIDCEIIEVLTNFFDLIERADSSGIKLIGLNSTGNIFYSKNKYSKYGLVDGRCFAIKKTDFRFHKDISTIPDYYASAYHLKKYGGNLIYNHYFLEFERYKEKGLGTKEQREDQKEKDVSLMLKLFPNNVALKHKPGFKQGTHLIVKR